MDLNGWAGKAVDVVRFLTLCSGICKKTTGNLLQVEDALRVGEVNHSDGFEVNDSHGSARFVTDATSNIHGQLNPKLFHFLPAEGLHHLARPETPNWTPDELLAAIGWVTGQSQPSGQAS